MGVPFSCPFAEYSDVQSGLESVIVKSICIGDEEVKTPVRTVSFNSQDLEPTILKSLGCGKMVKERSVSFKESELEAMISRTSSLPSNKEKDESTRSTIIKICEMDCQNSRSDDSTEKIQQTRILDPNNPEHEAAIKLQKVYKSFRTRRKLADCAVLVEQSWWKLLDFAELKRSSISFFDIEKHETAISRWSRARTRAAKVGKGLSKNDRAQKLALQHWLEAIDPRHRYGHNLHFYYDKWLHSQSREPFFYWLDIGEGKEVNLVNKCPRWKLHQQCIKYLGPMERKAYEVIVKDGKFFYKQSGFILDTSIDNDSKWIFVLSTTKNMYVGVKKKGTFQHSSFLAGGATMAAGRLVVESGMLKAVWPHSGHYRPTEQNFNDFVSFLKENSVDLTDVKMSAVDEEGSSDGKQRNSMHIRNHSSDEDLVQAIDGLENEENSVKDLSREKTDSTKHETTPSKELQKLDSFQSFSRKLPSIEVRRSECLGRLDTNNPAVELSSNNPSAESPMYIHDSVGASASEQEFTNSKQELSNEEDEKNEEEPIPQEAILQRINSLKGMNSYQLGKQLSCKWTTGAGPRIGCVRDYPCQLQFRALEKLNLSPTCAGYNRSRSSPLTVNGCNPLTPSPQHPHVKMESTTSLPLLGKENSLTQVISLYRTESSPLEHQ